MLRNICRISLFAALVLPSLACAQSPFTLIRDARVFDGETVHARASVLIREGVIVEVAPELSVPSGALVVDASGLTLLPGLIDAHTHAFGDALREALVFGVTTELDMFTEPGMAASMRAQQRAGGATGRADLFSAGVLATAPGGHGTEYGFAIPTITSADSAQAFVDARIAEGSDWIKIVHDDGALFGLNWPTIELPVLRALIDAAHRRERLAVVHVSTLRQAQEAIDAGADGLVHLFTDSLPPASFVETVRSRGAFIIPTLVVLKSITGVGGAAPLVEDARIAPYLVPASAANLTQSFPASPDAAQRYAIPLETVSQLHAAGVPILAGTDAPNPGTAHGSAMHRELELLVEAGLTPVEAIRAATFEPARRFRLEDRGRIAPGLRADLLLVRGDPTTDIAATRAIEAVWKGGERVDRVAWERSATAARDAAGRPPAGLGEGVLSDFEHGEATASFGTPWMPNTDSFAGGTSTVTVKVTEGGANGSSKALRLSGTITATLPQAWASVMWSPGAQPMQPADLSATEGLRFHVRGDGRTHRVLVFAQGRGMMPQMHAITATGTWTEIVLPWSTFNTDGSDVMAILFVGSPPAGDFWFEIDDVELR
jgi:imidazolonepropionase-like amidohydrolase